MILDLVSTIGGMILPPAVDFIKKKFLGSDKDTAEATISSLAVTKPEIMPQYIESMSKLKEAQIKFFNRDIIGTPSIWVINLRAAIRPIVICMFLPAIIFSICMQIHIDAGLRCFIEAIISEWFGSRLIK